MSDEDRVARLRAEAEANKPKETGLGKAMGVVMVRALENAYANGRGDARAEIEEKVANLPVRIRQRVELIPLASVLRIIHDLDNTD